jgi:hypothetical protein
VLIVAFYSYIDKYYGAFVVGLILLYYSFIDSLVYSEGFREQLPNEIRKEFESQYCDNGRLHFKNMNVKLDQIQHIFPEVVFHENTCNPCDKNCDFNIIEYKP